MNPTIVPTKFTLIDDFSAKMKAMKSLTAQFADSAKKQFNNAGASAFKTAKTMAVVSAAVIAPLALVANQAVKFEDRMSDVAKTTGMQGKELSQFGDFILDMSRKTRSSIEDLSAIAEIGGRLGIPRKELKAFTTEANKFAVALGGDFSGGVESAITQFGKVTALFRDTKSLDVSSALNKAGSAMNSLSAKGVNVEGLTDFSLRVGALPEVLRPSLAATTALGATLQKAGVDSQIASSGFSNFITTAGQNLPAFAKQMQLTNNQARQLFNSDSASFFAEFANSVQGMPADKLARTLKNLGLNSLEVQKAVGSMAGSQKVYNDLLEISNAQMKSGTSIQDEYNTKNDNMAGKMAKLKNTISALAIKLGQALLPIISNIVDAVSPFLNGISDWISKNKGLATTLAKVAVGVGIFAGAVSVLSGTIGLVQKTLAIGKIAIDAFRLASTTALGPIVLITAAIGAIAAVTYSIVKANSVYKTSAELVSEVNGEALKRTREQRVELSRHFDTLRKAKEGTDQYKSALSSIEQIVPGITEKYNLQKKSLDALNAAERESIALIMERMRAEVARESAKKELTEAQRIREGDLGSMEILGMGLSNATFWNPFSSQKEGIKAFSSEMENQAKQHDFNAERLLNQASQHETNAQNIQDTPAQGKGGVNSNINNVITVDFKNMPEGAVASTPTKGNKGTMIKLQTNR